MQAATASGVAHTLSRLEAPRVLLHRAASRARYPAWHRLAYAIALARGRATVALAFAQTTQQVVGRVVRNTPLPASGSPPAQRGARTGVGFAAS
jgi:hypothetical protein